MGICVLKQKLISLRTSEMQKNPFEDDERLLVEKYRDCWSHLIFEGFTKGLLDKIEGESG